jgi:fatty acid desaturase
MTTALDSLDPTTIDSSTEDPGEASWRAALTRDEIRELLEMRDLRSWWTLAVDWGLIAGAFALVAYWPNPLTVIAALFIIGARQLGLAVIMHEASHRSFMRSRAVNDCVGNWLAAYPIWADLRPYRPYHLQHHSKTGGPGDPDLGLIKPFPITPTSLRRKVWRDLSGRTGWKFAKAAWRRTFGQWGRDADATRAAQGMLVTNAALLAALTAAGHPALYLLWVGAWLSTHTLVTRIRSIAEHALTPDGADPLGNTRTTIATWWERLLLAPNRVNFHLEHHLLMTVPHYNLPRMHELLRARGVLDRACVERGYRAILRRAASKATPPGSAEPRQDAGINGFYAPPPAS